MSVVELTDTKRKELWKILQKGPKPQLHLHLDGSLSYEFIVNAAKRLRGRQDNHKILFEKDWEPSNEEELFEWFSDISHKKVNTNGFTEKNVNWIAFDICNLFLQTQEDLSEATSNIVQRSCIEHNVNYLEIRFAPKLHTREGLSEKEAINAIAEGFKDGVDKLKGIGKDFYGGLILCILRSEPPSKAVELVELTSSLDNEYVLGFDIAGDEGSFPLKLFEEALLLAKEKNINVTVHAGEWNEKLYDNIIENLSNAIDFGAKRIGHGTAFRAIDKDDEILKKLRENDVAVEINLTSNCTEPSNVSCFKEHPLPTFFDKGIKIGGLNIDNWLLAGNMKIGRAEPTGEYVKAVIDCGLTSEQLLETVKGGYSAVFYKNVPLKFIEDSINVWKNEVIPELEAWKAKNM